MDAEQRVNEEASSPSALNLRETPPEAPASLWWGRATAAGLLAIILVGTWTWTNSLQIERPLVLESEEASRALAAVRRVPVGEVIPMVEGSEHRWVMASGFDRPEPDGTWIVKKEAVIVLEPAEGSASEMTLLLYPLLSDQKPSRRVSISTSAADVDAVLTGGGQEVTVGLVGRGSEEILIQCESLDTPMRLGLGPDERPLCAKLISIQLSP